MLPIAIPIANEREENLLHAITKFIARNYEIYCTQLRNLLHAIIKFIVGNNPTANLGLTVPLFLFVKPA